MNKERTIILHYHLFKNAGTSVDAILKRNFGDAWVTREFPGEGGNNTALVEQWIRDTPDAVAYSSHTMMGPIPQVDGVQVISLMLLRDPIERIKSAYRFERTQDADTWGAQLAKEHDFEGYVRERLARPGDRQCRNVQTHRWASRVPGEGTELERASRALEKLTIVGRVEEFDEAMVRLASHLVNRYSGLNFDTVQANKSASSDVSGDNLATIDALNDVNRSDYFLLNSMNQI